MHNLSCYLKEMNNDGVSLNRGNNFLCSHHTKTGKTHRVWCKVLNYARNNGFDVFTDGNCLVYKDVKFSPRSYDRLYRILVYHKKLVQTGVYTRSTLPEVSSKGGTKRKKTSIRSKILAIIDTLDVDIEVKEHSIVFEGKSYSSVTYKTLLNKLVCIRSERRRKSQVEELNLKRSG